MNDFRPSTHGFRFANRFDAPLVAPALRWLAVPATYGLCGGMAALAADCFAHGQRIPQTDAPPRAGSALHRALVRRQLATFGAAPTFPVVRQFAGWTASSDAAVAEHTRPEYDAALEHVQRGRLVQLGLVYEDRLTRLWHNHQVLAYAAVDGPGGLRLRVYDPNFPRRDDVWVGPAPPGRGDGQPARTAWMQRAGRQWVRTLRGFFVIPLDAQPPALP